MAHTIAHVPDSDEPDGGGVATGPTGANSTRKTVNVNVTTGANEQPDKTTGLMGRWDVAAKLTATAAVISMMFLMRSDVMEMASGVRADAKENSAALHGVVGRLADKIGYLADKHDGIKIEIQAQRIDMARWTEEARQLRHEIAKGQQDIIKAIKASPPQPHGDP